MIPAQRYWRRQLYAFTGCSLVVLAALGAVLPVLPCTPFLLLASACFSRSSPRLEAWLRRSPWFGPILEDWHVRRGIRRRVKFWCLAAIAAVFVATLAHRGVPRALLPWSAALMICGAFVVWRLPVVAESHPAAGSPAAAG